MSEHLELLTPGWADAMARATSWRPQPGRYLVIAPHPDDEAVMFGGHLAHLAGRTDPVHLVAVTDGEAAYPGLADGVGLAGRRCAEQTDALTALGLADTSVSRLALPDGDVESHERALTDAIAELISAHRINVVLAPWTKDHHTDHEACGRAARRAAADASHPVALVSGLFWSMLRGSVGEHVELRALELTADERARKRHAIESHRSQITSEFGDEPVLGEAELSITRWAREYVMVDPANEAET